VNLRDSLCDKMFTKMQLRRFGLAVCVGSTLGNGIAGLVSGIIIQSPPNLTYTDIALSSLQIAIAGIYCFTPRGGKPIKSITGRRLYVRKRGIL
jgi:hypothetical protein